MGETNNYRLLLNVADWLQTLDTTTMLKEGSGVMMYCGGGDKAEKTDGG